MDEEKLNAILKQHSALLSAAFDKWADRVGQMMDGVSEALRDTARIAEEGPRERWRQNLAASVQLTLIRQAAKTEAVLDHAAIAADAVKHADALLAAIEKKE